jgi:alkanesulfonate monooxygenase SsuD/methylene tetrahydromethanopterin reductase-like flavin-dependent oxidoreductase (luciferase family)
MRFGFMSEAETPEHQSYFHRLHELVEEVKWADRLGFDFFACSEQHFTFGATISAPECLFSYLFPLTQRIRFRHAVALLPQRINHPLRVAERIATEDILSGGRIELGTGRANTPLIVKAFEVDPDRSRAEWREGVELIRRAFTEDPFSFDGEFYKVPKRYLVPKPVQQPYPPISVAATSPESMVEAAELDIGVMTSSYFFGWQWLEILANTYFDAIGGRNGESGVKPSFTPMLYTYCAETDEEARAIGFPAIYNTARMAVIAFARLAEISKSYGYMAQANEIAEKISDPDWLIEESGTVVCGSPETCVRQLRRYVEMGATEIIIRIDGVSHKDTVSALELLAKEVLPHFDDRLAAVPAGMIKGGMT